MKKSDSISKTEAVLRLKELCSHAEKSPAEVKNKLTQWRLDQYYDEILKELINEKFIDSFRFAKAFIHDKIQFNKWGRLKVKYQLRAHDIDDSTIEEALSDVDLNQYIEMIYNELIKKRHSLKEKNLFKLKGKIFAFAHQRGYEADIVNRFLNDIF
ncbi:MAG: RecX family transcriptional regulator [Bacteroidales bacterium]|nr:RecX family transcriptional regulator [Bacteroidales bacterium]